MKKLLLPLMLFVLLLGSNLNAATLVFWDTNGAAPGSGSDAPSGTWGVDAYWNEDAAGQGSGTIAYRNGDHVVFAAGDDASGAYTVTVANGVQTGDVHVDMGEVTFVGGQLHLDNVAGKLLSVGHKDVNAVARFNLSLTGADGIVRYKRGTMIFGATNTYTGDTTIEGGVLQLGAPQVIPADSTLVLANNEPTRGDYNSAWQATPAVFATGGFSQQMGDLRLSGGDASVDRIIDFGNGASALAFADSSGNDWGSFTLKIVNYTPGSDSLRFGTNNSGLNSIQLSQIQFVDFEGVGGKIDAQGFVTPNIPTITILSVARVGNSQTDLTWTSVSGRSYRIQYKNNLSATSWSDIVPDVPAIDTTTSYSDSSANGAARFYRIALVP